MLLQRVRYLQYFHISYFFITLQLILSPKIRAFLLMWSDYFIIYHRIKEFAFSMKGNQGIHNYAKDTVFLHATMFPNSLPLS